MRRSWNFAKRIGCMKIQGSAHAHRTGNVDNIPLTPATPAPNRAARRAAILCSRWNALQPKPTQGLLPVTISEGLNQSSHNLPQNRSS